MNIVTADKYRDKIEVVLNWSNSSKKEHCYSYDALCYWMAIAKRLKADLELMFCLKTFAVDHRKKRKGLRDIVVAMKDADARIKYFEEYGEMTRWPVDISITDSNQIMSFPTEQALCHPSLNAT